MEFLNYIVQFLEQAQTSNLKTQHFFPKRFKGLKLKLSFGQGAAARIPWIAFLKENQEVSNGIYPVFLYYKKQSILILAYGVSETEQSKTTWEIENSQTIKNYFQSKYSETPDRYGESLIHKIYNLDLNNKSNYGLNKEEIENDLDVVTDIYLNRKNNEVDNTQISNQLEALVKNNEFLIQTLSIKTKPFIILAGISGTGKSRLVRKLAYQFNNIPEDKAQQKSPPSNYQLIKVKPNWHDSSELLGYESRISGKDKYILTDFVKFIVKAWQHPQTPFFLCLDEMNLAPVEQYFAEYLSVIETREVKNNQVQTDALIGNDIFKKYNTKTETTDFVIWDALQLSNTNIQQQFIASGLTIPSNLIVMGTVNMDETTHSFSRKVLDRAMTIEMNAIDLNSNLNMEVDELSYLENSLNANLVIGNKTHGNQVYEDIEEEGNEIIAYLISVNDKLASTPFQIAYRVRDEFLLYAYNYSLNNPKPDNWLNLAIDNMTCMKILPRIEGDEEKTKVLEDLIELFKKHNLTDATQKAIEMNNRRKAYHYTSFWS